jgi:2-methylcitrate dehydratase
VADQALDQIADFVTSLSYDDLPPDVVEFASSVVVDTLGCAVAGLDSPGPRMAASSAAPGDAAVIGTRGRRAEEDAAFWNTSAIRYLDFNDTLVTGHPSDELGAIFATAGALGSSGPEVLAALVTAYETHARLADRMQHHLIVDQVYLMTIAATAGLCHLRGCSRSTTWNALSMAATSGLALRASRTGELSDYKGLASAVNMRQAVFVVRMAEHGLTGPSAPVNGKQGLAELLEGRGTDFSLADFDGWRIHDTWQKYWPGAYNMAPSIWAALELREQVAPECVASITLRVAPLAWEVSGSEPEKWHPKTRETADHSLPYTFAYAMRAGTVDDAAFEPEAIGDPTTSALVQKIVVEPDWDLGPSLPSVIGTTAVATDVRGGTHEVRVTYPVGHDRNPMTRDQLEAKVRRLAEPRLGDRTGAALEAAWGLRSAERFTDVLDAFVVE